MIAYASNRRFQLGIHSTGDRAIDAVVDGFIKALEKNPWDARHYVIHAEYTTPECARRMGKYNIGVSTNSLVKRQIADFSIQVTGPERAARAWPHKTLVNAGVHLADACDAPVQYPDWQMGIESLITRESKASGKVSGPEECLAREEAIRAWTIEGAWLDHAEHLKGSIEPGKLADLCIVDRDILTVDVHDIHKIQTLMTMVDGRIVFNAEPDQLKTKRLKG
jgi:predicted amidohydrolase YtcJ